MNFHLSTTSNSTFTDDMTYPIDPVNLAPIPPLIDSYTYHSAPHQDDGPEGWIMGIDEAGRGREFVLLRICSRQPLHNVPLC
jgi:hypothetical protein